MAIIIKIGKSWRLPDAVNPALAAPSVELLEQARKKNSQVHTRATSTPQIQCLTYFPKLSSAEWEKNKKSTPKIINYLSSEVIFLKCFYSIRTSQIGAPGQITRLR